jgi:hypothetical protein
VSDRERFEALDEYTSYENSGMVQPKVILEPLKGRIITKPVAGDYIKMRRYQQCLWRLLKNRKEFQLIGRPVKASEVS